MGFLIRKTSKSRWVQVLLGIWAMAVVLVTCSAPVPMADAGPHFSHAWHVGELDIACSLCHSSATAGGIPTMPGIRLCKPCHDEFDPKKPVELRVESFFSSEGRFKAQHVARLSDEIQFDHGQHVLEYGLRCQECHGSTGTSEIIPMESRVTMDRCIACHAEKGKPVSCEDCHKEVRRDWAPESHARDWLHSHGKTWRRCEGLADKGGWSNRCEICHEKTTCQSCHKESMPRNHTNFWRIKGHSLMTSIDRTSCWTCHRSDFCQRCHESTRPRSHTATWGSPRDRHCNNCHAPGVGSSCATCHKSAPSHAAAAPMPVDHNPAMNCRQCHGNGQPLPHPDPGITCTSCHK